MGDVLALLTWLTLGWVLRVEWRADRVARRDLASIRRYEHARRVLR